MTRRLNDRLDRLAHQVEATARAPVLPRMPIDT